MLAQLRTTLPECCSPSAGLDVTVSLSEYFCSDPGSWLIGYNDAACKWQNRGSTINAVIWSFVAVYLLTVVARLFGRIKVTSNVGWDDFWILISMVGRQRKMSLHQSD